MVVVAAGVSKEWSRHDPSSAHAACSARDDIVDRDAWRM